MKTYAVGADIGGGHITTALVCLTSANIVPGSLSRKEVNAQGDADSILTAWIDSVKASIKQATDAENIPQEAINGLGLAMPGPFDYENGICLINDPSQNKFLSLYQMNLRNELAARTGFAPENIRFKNDAECFLLGEVFGKKDIRRAIGVTLGTGFGSAFVFDGVSEDANLWCAPFKDATAEEYISTRWFVNRYKALTGKDIQGAKELAMTYASDPVAKQVFDEFANNFCEFMYPLAVEKQADTIILGGNIAKAWNLFIAPLKEKLAKALPHTRIKEAILGEQAALVGSASLLNQ